VALLDRAGRTVLGHAVSYSRLLHVVCRLTAQAPIAPSPVVDDWCLLRCGIIFSG
jgi:hypothetical protein